MRHTITLGHFAIPRVDFSACDPISSLTHVYRVSAPMNDVMLGSTKRNDIRLFFSASSIDPKDFAAQAMQSIMSFLKHEVEEHLQIDGEFAFNPHPEIQGYRSLATEFRLGDDLVRR